MNFKTVQEELIVEIKKTNRDLVECEVMSAFNQFKQGDLILAKKYRIVSQEFPEGMKDTINVSDILGKIEK